MNYPTVKDAISLTLPDTLRQEWNEEAFNRYIEGQKAIDRFLGLELTPKELSEFLGDVSKVNVNDWLDCVDSNIFY